MTTDNDARRSEGGNWSTAEQIEQEIRELRDRALAARSESRRIGIAIAVLVAGLIGFAIGV